MEVYVDNMIIKCKHTKDHVTYSVKIEHSKKVWNEIETNKCVFEVVSKSY